MPWQVKPPEQRLDGRVHAAISLRQRRDLERMARRREVSVSELVREGVGLLLGQNGGKPREDETDG